jgi:hypothetical protein
MVTPMIPINNSIFGGFYPPVVLFANDYVAGRFSPFGSTRVGDVYSGSNLNTMFTSADFATVASGQPGLKFRPVGIGLRVRYIGTQLNMRGRLATIQTPDHEDISSMFATTYNNFDQTKLFPVTKNWVMQSWSPSDSDEVDLSSLTVVTATPGDPPPNEGQVPYPIGAIFNYSSIAGEGFSFEYEVVAIHEVCGSSARGATKSVTDPVGFEAILSSVDTVGKKVGSEFYNALLNKVTDFISHQSGPAAVAMSQVAANKFIQYADRAMSGYGSSYYE